MKKIILLSLMFGLVGCAAPKYNYQATPQNVSRPPIGSINEAFVGDKLLEQGVFVEREAINVPKTAKSSGYTFNAGYYLKTGDDKKGQYYQAINMIPNGGNVQKSVFVDPVKAVMIDEENRLCAITVFNAKSCTEEHEAKATKIGVASDNSFQQTLIYSGKVGNKINIGYREFSSNLARPAFNNDVEYDLSESKEIGYKGALLQIIDANNQNIKYKVIRNFNKVD
ncbi:hypothetical protein [Acinetobacter baumannii]|uniref:hypothetical protein n=1 Tax=Acinetobacter baumannii TaxID=470 RepID=UPI002AB46FBB|nr:hypothetical protein [Acinetobacter baumannii]